MNFTYPGLCAILGLLTKDLPSNYEQKSEIIEIHPLNSNFNTNCTENADHYIVCNNHAGKENNLFLTELDCSGDFIFNEREKTCDFKDKELLNRYVRDKSCLYGEVNPGTCAPYDITKTCDKDKVYTTKPAQVCVENPNRDVTVEKLNEDSIFVETKINTKDYFYIQTKNIYHLRVHLYFKTDEIKIEKLEKLMQDIATKMIIYYMALSSYAGNTYRDLYLEIEKWSLKMAIEDYHFYYNNYDETIHQTKFGQKDVSEVLERLANQKNVNDGYFGDLNLFISNYDVDIRTDEPEFKIYYQDTNKKILKK